MSLGWDTSFHLNGKFPLLDNTIFNTVDSALNFIRDVNSSAIAGTIIGVTDSSNISSSGIYEIFNDNGELALRKLATLELLRESVSNVLDLITNQSGNYNSKLAELAALQTLQLEALRNEIFSPDGETAPVTRTMMLQVGSDSTNYRFSTSEIGEKDTDGVINNNGILQFLRGTLFHFSITLENSSLAKLWNVSNEYIIEDVDRNQTNLIEFFNLKSIPLGESLWIYFLASKNGTNAKWYISPIKYAWNEVGVPGLVNGNSDYYYLLYGYCGYTKLKNAFFEPLYGNTWIKGSTIYTGKVLTMDGTSALDLDNNTLKLRDDFYYADGLIIIGNPKTGAFVFHKHEDNNSSLHVGTRTLDTEGNESWNGMTFADGKLIIGKYDDQIKNLQSQIDNDIQTWFGKGYPVPALITGNDEYITEGKDSITTISEGKFTMEGLSPETSIDEDPNHHLGDIFINLVDSSSWRFIKDVDNQFKWQFISDEALSSVYKVLGDLDRQIDNKITTWVLGEDPAADWFDDPGKNETWETGKDYKKYHLGDLWYNTGNKEAKQYKLSEEEYKWIDYDGGTSIFDFIDGKRTIYNSLKAVSEDGYHTGDWWCLETDSNNLTLSYTDDNGNPKYLLGLLLVATRDKNTEFSWEDWEILLLNPKEVQNEVTKIKNDVDTIKTALDIVLDGQTTIGDSFVQTMMLRIGADSTNYILLKTSTSGNRMTNLYWDGDYLKAKDTDTLIHLSYGWKDTSDKVHQEWLINTGTTAKPYICLVDPTEDTPIYIYIFASSKKNEARWIGSSKVIDLVATTGSPGYYFPFGTIVDQSTKTLIEIRGNTKIIGDRIITGKLESNTGNSYFDLDNGTFVLGKSEEQPNGAFNYINGIVHIEGSKVKTESLILTVDELLIYLSKLQEGSGTTIFSSASLALLPGEYRITKGETIENGGYDSASDWLGLSHIEVTDLSSLSTNKFLFNDYFTVPACGTVGIVYGPTESNTYPTILYDGSGSFGVYLEDIKIYKKQTGFESNIANLLESVLNLGATDISGGLVLTNAIGLRNSDGKITAGISGIMDNNNTVAFWAGADLNNKEDAPVKLTYKGIGSTIGPFRVKDANTISVSPINAENKNPANIYISNNGVAKLQLFTPGTLLHLSTAKSKAIDTSIGGSTVTGFEVARTLNISSEALSTSSTIPTTLTVNYENGAVKNLGGEANSTLKEEGINSYDFILYENTFLYASPKAGLNIQDSKYEINEVTIPINFTGWQRNSSNAFTFEGICSILINDTVIKTISISKNKDSSITHDSGTYFQISIMIPKIENISEYLINGKNTLCIKFKVKTLQRWFNSNTAHYSYILDGKGADRINSYILDITVYTILNKSIEFYAGFYAKNESNTVTNEDGQISSEGFSFRRNSKLITASVRKENNLYVLLQGLPDAPSSGTYYQIVCDSTGKLYKKSL